MIKGYTNKKTSVKKEPKFFSKTINTKTTEDSVVNLTYKRGNGFRVNIDLCPECVESFKSWLYAFEIGAPEETESEETK